jgi:hypothetical protein
MRADVGRRQADDDLVRRDDLDDVGEVTVEVDAHTSPEVLARESDRHAAALGAYAWADVFEQDVGGAATEHGVADAIGPGDGADAGKLAAAGGAKQLAAL